MEELKPLASPLRLHIGGEEVRAGWRILNIQPGPGVDFVGTCKDLGQFADASVTEIYASHVYEHLDYATEILLAFKEAHRVLCPDGMLRVSVPDLTTLCQLFVHPQVSTNGRWQLMRIMFGGQTDAHDFHKVGLTWEFLTRYLHLAGFRSAKRVDDFGLFDDVSALRLNGVPISLNVEATK
jgi:predicted SAM-dependent methyltransferase